TARGATRGAPGAPRPEAPLAAPPRLETDVVTQDYAGRVDTAVTGEARDERAQIALPSVDDDRGPRAHGRLAVTERKATSSSGRPSRETAGCSARCSRRRTASEPPPPLRSTSP